MIFIACFLSLSDDARSGCNPDYMFRALSTSFAATALALSTMTRPFAWA